MVDRRLVGAVVQTLTSLLCREQEGDFQSETIRFGTERMVIDSWVRKRTYDTFREFVGSGMNYHLQVKLSNVENASKKEIFKVILEV